MVGNGRRGSPVLGLPRLPIGIEHLDHKSAVVESEHPPRSRPESIAGGPRRRHRHDGRPVDLEVMDRAPSPARADEPERTRVGSPDREPLVGPEVARLDIDRPALEGIEPLLPAEPFGPDARVDMREAAVLRGCRDGNWWRDDHGMVSNERTRGPPPRPLHVARGGSAEVRGRRVGFGPPTIDIYRVRSGVTGAAVRRVMVRMARQRRVMIGYRNAGESRYLGQIM
jgi:hypothetical protein